MDEQAKKTALRKITYGLYVVGAKREGEVNASTVNWLSQCSFSPPLVMVGIKKGTTLHEMVTTGRVFSVNVLGENQKELAEHFFRPVHQVGDKLGEVKFHAGATGAPILEEAVAFFECEVTQVVEGGDHDIVIGRVVEAGVHRDVPPLVMASTGWHYGG